jgi:hypothetical protein
MRALSLLIAGSLALILDPSITYAQKKAPPPGPGQTIRYFQFAGELFDDLQDDGFLRETRQSGKVVSAILDVCYSVSAGSGRKDRFVVELQTEGGKLVGKAESQEEKVPISVNLVRKVTGKTFAFEGTVTRGTVETTISVTDKSDVGEAEFRESLPAEDTIEAQPKDFTELSPGAVDVQVQHAAVVPFVKELRGQDVTVDLGSLVADCAELRSGKQLIQLSVDPERASALIAKLKGLPGVVAAGWGKGTYVIDNAVRLAAADWKSNGKFDRERLAAVGASAAKTLSAKVDSSTWDAATGELTLKLKRPSDLVPGLDLTENVEFKAIVGPEKPGSDEALIVWVGNTNIEVKDEGTGPRLGVIQPSGGDEESGSVAPTVDIVELVAGLVRDLKGRGWDSEAKKWVP